MGKITCENFEQQYVDPIEQQQIDHFVCMEMGRQMHRYIKGMSGRKCIMEKFEDALKTLTDEEKENAIARYIDLNRKAISGLDFKVVVARSMANYCDTYDYLLTMLRDERRMDYYLARVKDKYVRFHEVFEQDGKFGIRDHEGRELVSPQYDFLRTCYVYVDDLVTMPIIAQKDGKFGLILPDRKDTVVEPFAYDDIQLLDEPPYFEGIVGGRKKPIDIG